MYVRPERELERGYVEPERKRKPYALACLGAFFSILLLILTIGYVVASLLAVFDKRGREVYFEDDPTEYNFTQAKELKLASPTGADMYTEDWGYFYRAYERGNHSYWSQYDVFLLIIVTMAVTSFMWFIVSLLNIYKYATIAWRLAGLTFALNLITFIFNIVGSVWIFYRISIFVVTHPL